MRKHWEGLAWRLGDLIGRRVIFTLQGFEECGAHVELICVHHTGHRVGFPCWMHSNRPKGLWSLHLKKQFTSIFVHLVCLCCLPQLVFLVLNLTHLCFQFSGMIGILLSKSCRYHRKPFLPREPTWSPSLFNLAARSSWGGPHLLCGLRPPRYSC